MPFTSTLDLRPPRAHLTIAGELDLMGAVQLRCELAGALARGCTVFTVDATDVTFVDAAGLGALVWLRNSTSAVDGSLAFSAASRRFTWVCGVAHLQSAFGIDTLHAGMTA